MEEVFSSSELEAIAKTLGNTYEGLTGSEISRILTAMKIDEPNYSMSKSERLYNAFNILQSHDQSRRSILEFIQKAMKPERYIKQHSLGIGKFCFFIT